MVMNVRNSYAYDRTIMARWRPNDDIDVWSPLPRKSQRIHPSLQWMPCPSSHIIASSPLYTWRRQPRFFYSISGLTMWPQHRMT